MTQFILIDKGDMFEGTVDQFKDCFFDNADHDTIKRWCEDEGYTFRLISKSDRIVEIKNQLSLINAASDNANNEIHVKYMKEVEMLESYITKLEN